MESEFVLENTPMEAIAEEEGPSRVEFLTDTVKSVETLEDESVLLNGRFQLFPPWSLLDLQAEMLFNVVLTQEGRPRPRDPILVTRHQNMLILCPQLLISITTLSDSFGCSRRPVLAMQFAQFPDECLPSRVLIAGSIAHEIFERLLLRNFTQEDAVEQLIKAYWEQIYVAGLEPKDIKETLGDLISDYEAQAKPPPFIKKVLGCEETVYCPKYGLKGKLDAIIEDTAGLRVPLELKTGSREDSVSHRAQTQLYSLLISSTKGYLYFCRSKRHLVLENKASEVVDLMMARNRLVQNLVNSTRNSTLPPKIKNNFLCGMCPYKSACYAIPDEKGALVKRWLHAIDAEEQTVQKANLLEALPIHTVTACLPCGERHFEVHFTGHLLVMVPSDPVIVTTFSLGGTTTYGASMGFYHSPGRVRLNRPVGVGLACCVQKDEIGGNSFNLWRSTMVRCQEDPFLWYLLTAQADRRGSIEGPLSPPLTPMKAAASSPDAEEPVPSKPDTPEVQRASQALDDSQMGAVRFVLSNARELCLIHGMPGTGKTTTIAHLIACLLARLDEHHLDDGCLLVTSHTHSALDNVLLKCLDLGVSVTRVCSSSTRDKVHPRLRGCIHDPVGTCATFPEVDLAYRAIRVVGCTSMALSNLVFSRLVIHSVIVDEAAQMSIPATLVCLRLAKPWTIVPRAILVGDPCQLRPLVRSTPRNPGTGLVERNLLGRSLFEQCWQGLPVEHQYSMRKQYRMNADIQWIANQLFYDGKLECANEAVARQTLRLSEEGGPLKGALAKRISSGNVLWIDCDAPEVRQAESYYNPREALLVASIVDLFLGRGIDKHQIGVISPFRPQVSHLQETIPLLAEQISTIDRYQGLDTPILIISFVRSNGDRQCGVLCREWRRINVALTRTKAKLIIVGSLRTVGDPFVPPEQLADEELARGHDVLCRFKKLLLERDWVVPANEGGLDDM